ncbi:AP-5 complex subunit beta-1-like [Tubulanus polymorphus]|uniref:AP-5 complex subunit beta-1-like n=1 Tax=Tubulanus polymorphus TaxID=672921 RepID=UPI003DA63FF9
MCAYRLASDNHLSELANFRLCPSAFLSVHQITDHQTFVLDVLQVLCSENVSDPKKVHLLSLLQEYGTTLLPNKDSVEQTVASLQDIFTQNRDTSSTMFRSQLLITITCILTAGEFLEQLPLLFKSFVDILLDVVSRVNQPAAAALRGNACQCLQEMEVCYPGILCSKIDHFYQMCQLETTFMCHNYMSLFVTTLKNCIDTIVSSHQSVDDNILVDILCNRKEPLKPLILPTDLSLVQLQNKDMNLDDKTMPINVETKELKKVISYVMDNTSVLTAPSHYSTLVQLTLIIKKTPQFSPSIFKPHLLRFMGTMDVNLFYMVFFFKLHFGRDLISEQQSQLLINRLLQTLHHPSISAWLRLLLYEWFLHFPDDEDEISSESVLPVQLDYTQYAPFFPTVFDGVDTKMKKLDVLSLCFRPGPQPDSASAILMSCLVSLHKVVHYGVGGSAVSALFRILFVFYQRHRHSTLAVEIQKYVLGIVMEQPKFSPYAVDFLSSVQTTDPKSSLPLDILTALTKQIVTTPVEQILPNIQYYLMTLEVAIQRPEINPNDTIRFLQQVLDSSDILECGIWSLGNSILAVCHSILQSHDTKRVFIELGDLLCCMFKDYADIDIRDRAKFLYAMMVTLSSKKLSTILLKNPSSHKAINLANLVTGESNFPAAQPIVHLEEAVIELKKLDDPISPARNENIPDVEDTKLLNLYWSVVHDKSKTSSISKTYQIQLKSTSTFQTVYAVLMKFTSNPKYASLNEVYLPVLESEIDGVTVDLEFKPLEPSPATFDASVTFTTDGFGHYSCHTQPLVLEFSDLFQVIGLSAGVTNTAQRALIFDNLWKTFTEKQNLAGSNCAESLRYIPVCKNILSKVVKNRLHQFLMDSSDPDILKVGIFLLPRYHLLLQFKLSEEDCVVFIATDYWQMLPQVDKFLEYLPVKNKTN